MAAQRQESQLQAGVPFTWVDVSMLLVAVIWGVNAAVVKGAIIGWEPLAFNAIRFSGAALIIFLYVVLTDKGWRLARRDFGYVVLLGLVGNGIYQWLFMEGIARSTASNTALIIGMSPLVVTLWGAISGLDRMTAWIMSGTVVSLVGVVLVVLGQHGGFHFGGPTITGDLITFCAMLCWAAYTVYARPVIERVGSSLRVTAWAMLFGAVTNLLLGIPALTRQDFSLVTAKSIVGMSFSGLMALVVSYVIYAWAVRRVGGARTAIYLNLTPILGATVAWLFLGESWSLLQWLGALLAILGVTVAKMESFRPKAG